MTSIAISSGHGLHIRGARGNPVPPQVDERDENVRVVDKVYTYLQSAGVNVVKFHDNTSTSQNQNLNTIVNWHNKQSRELDVSVHFNAFDHTAHGTEVLYVTQEALSKKVCDAIVAAAGFTNRGAKYNGGLAFLNGTNKPAILIETCFCDNTKDCNKYNANFDAICRAIAETISGVSIPDTSHPPPLQPPVEPPASGALFTAEGKCSHFGGPEDEGVSPSEGLAFIYGVDEAPQLFLPYQPGGTTGLARRLNPYVHYVACRWDYSVTSKDMLKSGKMALVTANGMDLKAFPADWGPNENTGRVADLSPKLMEDLELETDGVVTVVFPYAG